MASKSASLTSIRSSLWFIPVTCVLVGLALSTATVAIDRAADFDLIPRALTGGPDASIAILTTIAASMVSLTALVLTITMVVVQLAMGQFSPRIVQTFLRDRPSQLAIGLFVATFAHAMVALREVDQDHVPGLAIVVSYVLVLTSIAMLVIYVHHIGRSLRVSALIELVGDDTRRLLDERFPDLLVTPAPDPSIVVAGDSGVVTTIDRERLVRLAAEADCVLHVIPPVGAFVPAGAPLVRIEGSAVDIDHDDVEGAVTQSLERTLEEDDVAFGLRMLVDIAERSLSDSPFLDPTTAVQAIDRLYDVLRHLCVRALPDGRYDDGTVLRVTVREMTWSEYVHLAFDEIRLVGAESPQISRRLVAVLDDLISVAPKSRRPPLEEQLDLLLAAVRALPRDDRDVATAAAPDAHGIGVTVAAQAQW
jgi:uncharacterized membrane protein